MVPVDDLQADAASLAERIGGFSKHTAMVALEAIDAADRMPMPDGVRFERRSYFALFDTPDAREGMAAFIDKRDPTFNVGS